MFTNQRTIKKRISLSGVGLHTGGQTTITFVPAPINHSVTFFRTDLENCPQIPADIEHVVDITRGTTIGINNIKIHTVEHVLAAIAGLQIDNLIVELSNSEPPVIDGSAKPFVDKLLEAGIAKQDAPKNYLEIDTPLSYSEKDRGIDIVVTPSNDLRITFMIDYKNPALGTQYTTLVDLDKEFVDEFAASRTFCFLSEVEELHKAGLIKGAGLDSAIVFVDRELTNKKADELKQITGLKEKVFVGKTGILNDVPLRFYNEPARHKLVDLLGDLFLIGVPLKAHILAARSGHAANVELAKKIRTILEKKLLTSRYGSESSNGKYLLDINAIIKAMPHRYPMLLIDRIIDLEPKKKVVAIKNVTFNEPHFLGHFPDHPVMPGVLIVEAMAQAGGFMLLNSIEEPDKKLFYFMGIDGVRFRKPVVPGDQLRFEIEMVQYRPRSCKISGKSYVDGKVVAEGTFFAVIVDR
ncbi:MAG: bifunctional UDP-3-O-[3-hydroxymyristoyl] N-acetylglucosamine deacetylase/3-hydroxyacyl-ACP dehydratase [candidate division Zixibacteria bacterium]|nr:bifunctional UDP-3-O-[3-hydroxymyristoyl] N-acetylglucosamine deacetylase/3-hydroxyacyl-ACP dehydratase [candidate division Zixibacteria bacterium]